MRKREKIFFSVSFFVAFFLFAFIFLGFRLGFNVTDSMPMGIYLQSSNIKNIKIGDVVSFCPKDKFISIYLERNYVRLKKDGFCGDERPLFIKKIIAQKGDTVEVKDHTVFINSKKIPRSFLFDTDENGLVLEHLPDGYRHELTENEFFCFGTGNERALDSRYYGIIHRDQIKFKSKILMEVK